MRKLAKPLPKDCRESHLRVPYASGDGTQFSGPAGMLLGSLVQPLLDWGKRMAEVERSRALYVERLAAFSQAYLRAMARGHLI